MKLTEALKRRIDNYFDNIKAEDLLAISVSKYGFKELSTIAQSEESFTNVAMAVVVEQYATSSPSVYFSQESSFAWTGVGSAQSIAA